MTSRSGEETPTRRRWRLPFFRRRRRAKSVDSESVPSEPSFAKASAPLAILNGEAAGWDSLAAPLHRRTPSLAVTEDRFTSGSCTSDRSEPEDFAEGILVRHLVRVTDRSAQTDISCLADSQEAEDRLRGTRASRRRREEKAVVELLRIVLLPFVIWLLLLGSLLRNLLLGPLLKPAQAPPKARRTQAGPTFHKHLFDDVIRGIVGIIILPILIPCSIVKAVTVTSRAALTLGGNLSPIFRLLQFMSRPRPHRAGGPSILTRALVPRGRGRPCRCRCSVM